MELVEFFEAAGTLVSEGGTNPEYDRGIAELLVCTGLLQGLVDNNENELLTVLIRGYELAMQEQRAMARQSLDAMKGGY